MIFFTFKIISYTRKLLMQYIKGKKHFSTCKKFWKIRQIRTQDVAANTNLFIFPQMLCLIISVPQNLKKYITVKTDLKSKDLSNLNKFYS